MKIQEGFKAFGAFQEIPSGSWGFQEVSESFRECQGASGGLSDVEGDLSAFQGI